MGLTAITIRGLPLLALAVALGGCADGVGPFGAGDDAQPGSGTRTTELVERDVEAPEVFQVTEPGLWDGRPSLGGVWVAHPDVKDPERVIIRNEDNGKFVIGALFRRERANPGPRLSVSSDAAEALGMLAGAPTELNVTALRREALSAESEAGPASIDDPVDPPDAAPTGTPVSDTLAAPASIAAESLDAPASTAAAAIEPAEARATPLASSLDKPFIQIGIFSVESNAENTAQSLRGIGIVPTVKEQSAKGKTFYRVIVGPSANASDRDAILRKVKGLGFEDAYFVSG